MTGARLTGSVLDSANLSMAVLRDVVFENARLNSTDLTATVVAGADLRQGRFESADLSGATGLPSFEGPAMWTNTTCPNGVNSDANGLNCNGTFSP